MSELIAIRLKSLMYSAGTLLVSTIAAALLSPEFVDQFIGLLGEAFGNTIFGTLILLLAPELVKYARNKWVLKQLGASGRKVILI